MGDDTVAYAPNEGYVHLISDRRPWYKNKRILALNFWICLLLITSLSNGYDESLISWSSPPAFLWPLLTEGTDSMQGNSAWETEFHDPQGGKLRLFYAIQNIGALSGYPFAPYMADYYGRRQTIFFGAAVMLLATFLQTVAHTFDMLIGARFLIGFGLTFAACAAPLLVAEVAFPSQRAQATSMYNILWYLGSIIASWITFRTFSGIHNNWAWRIPSSIQCLPFIIQISLIWFVPESPRWLISRGREEHGLKALAYYHANGDSNHPLVQYELEEIKTAIRYDCEAGSNIGWLALFKSPGNRRRMRIIIALALFSQFSGNNFISYYLIKVFISIGVTSHHTQLLINSLLNVFNIIVAVIAGCICERVGRRPLFLISTTGMFIIWILQTIFVAVYAKDGHKIAAGHGVVAMIFLYYGFYNLAFTPLIVSYTVDILPYPLRAKGFTVFNFMITLSSIFNQYVNPIALKTLTWRYYIVYIFWIAFQCIFCYYFIIETKGLSLEQTAAVFDGDDALDRLSAKTAQQADLANDDVEDTSKGSEEKIDSCEQPSRLSMCATTPNLPSPREIPPLPLLHPAPLVELCYAARVSAAGLSRLSSSASVSLRSLHENHCLEESTSIIHSRMNSKDSLRSSQVSLPSASIHEHNPSVSSLPSPLHSDSRRTDLENDCASVIGSDTSRRESWRHSRYRESTSNDLDDDNKSV